MISYFLRMRKKRGPKKGMKFHDGYRYEFGKYLAHERIRKGLTQAELADRMGTTVRVISHFEREVKNPPTDTVKKLSEALRLPVERLLFQKNDAPGNELPLDRGLSKRFDLAQKLPNPARHEIKKFIDAMAKANGVLQEVG